MKKNEQIKRNLLISHGFLHNKVKILSIALFLILFWITSVFQLQAQTCPDPTPTATVTAGTYNAGGGSVQFSSGVTEIVGDVIYGSVGGVVTIQVGIGATLVVTTGSHLTVQNFTNSGTLIIQEGATVSMGITPGVQGSFQMSNGSKLQMCSYSALENCGTTSFSEGTFADYRGNPDAKAILKFDTSKPPNTNGTLSMPNGAPGVANSSRIVLATPPPGTSLWNPTGSSGSATTCGIGGTCNTATGLPYTVGPRNSCGTFATQDPVGPCNAGIDEPVLSGITASNVCPATTVNLTTITASNLPAGTTLTWHTGTPATAANQIIAGNALTDPSSVPAGTYYAAAFDAIFNCFSPTTAVTATTISCVTTVTNPDVNAGLVNTTIPGNVNTNDTVPPGTTYGTAVPVGTNPSTAVPTVKADGSYTFTPTAPGIYTFDVPVCPAGQTTGCPTEKLVITVSDPASTTNPPVANTDIATAAAGTLVTIPVKANDGAGNPGGTLGLPEAITGVEPGATATVNPDGTIAYTPAPGFVGTDTFTYQVCETPSGLCTTATVEVTVLASGAPNTTSAADDYSATTGTTPATGNVKTNDIDPEGNTTTVTPQTNVAVTGGTFSVDAAGVYTFTPNAGFVGTVDIPYTICDNGSPVACADASLHVVVNPAPVTNPDVNAGLVNTTIPGNVNTNDTVPPGTTYGTAVPVGTNPSTAVPTVNADGSYTFTPTAPGIYTFDVPVCPAGQTTGCPTEKLVITVSDPASTTNPPVANTDIATAAAGTLVTIPVKANDGAGNPGGTLGLPEAITGVEPGATATVNPDGTIAYTPAPGFVGTDTFTYQVCETPSGLCTTATVEVTVLASGAPNTTSAADDYSATTGTTPATGNVKTNDIDPEGNTTTVTPQTNVAVTGGTFSVDAAGVYTFTPNAGFVGTVDIPYTICDNGSPVACADASLHVVVNPAPVTNPDVNAGLVNTTIPGNVNTNDTVPPGTTYGTAVPVGTNPSTAVPTVNADGSYTFTPTAPGIYTFDVPVCPAGQTTGCPTEKLVITVSDPASTTNPPVANTDIATAAAGTLVTIPVKANDGAGNPGGTLGLPEAITGVEPGATATVNPDGTIAYTPAPGFVGTDTFTYQVCETPSGLCTTATVEVTVLASGAPNTTSAADDYSATTGTTPATGNVKTNDIDPEGNTTTVTPQTNVAVTGGTFSVDAAGVYTFTPNAGFVGTVDIPYTICDNGSPVACADASLHVVVNPAPVTNPDVNAGLVNTTIPGNVNTNDTVPPGTTYGTAVPVGTNPSTAVPTVNADGSYTFTPTAPGIYTFDVPVCPAGQTTGCPTEKLVITVSDPASTTNPPVANTDIATAAAGTLVTIPVKANDGAGNPGGTLGLPEAITGVEPGATATVNPDGTIAYTPAPGFVGTDTFTYQVCETPSGLCTTATVEVTVLASGAPNTTSAADDYSATTGTTPATGNVKTNDIDPEGNTTTVTPQTNVAVTGGTFSVDAAGVYTFTPNAGFVGTVDIPYTICDNGSPVACADASLHVVVNPEICLIEVGGIVYLDSDRILPVNGAPADGAALGLFVTLVEGTQIKTTVPVSSAGVYKFTNVVPGTYKLLLGTTNTGSLSVSLPAGYFSIGEGGSVISGVSQGDGTVNSQTAVTIDCNAISYGNLRITANATYSDIDFGIFTQGPLPIELVSFIGTNLEDKVNLSWKTANEKNFSHFEVEKSLNAKEFGSIGKVNGANTNYYNLIDNNPSEGINYYRLKMVDLDGSSKFSKIIQVRFEKGFEFVSVENPATNGEFKVMTNFKNPIFTLLSSLGSKVEINVTVLSNNSFELKSMNSVAGIYYLNIESNGKLVTKKVLMP